MTRIFLSATLGLLAIISTAQGATATDPENRVLKSCQSNYDNNAAVNVAVKAVQEIQRSHIDGNVPTTKDFHGFLVRDLEKYFGALLKQKVRVEYELLRDQPTQSGVAYPKYYSWVRVFGTGEKLIEQGAVRIAAVEKTEFSVTHFWNIKKIHDDEGNLETIFPKALCPLILVKASAAAN
jgi:hypothetical protein